MQISNQPNPFTGTTIGDGSATVSSAGTRVQLSTTSTNISAVLIIAKTANAGTVWVGGSTVAAGRGRPLLSLQAELIQINNLNKVYIDADTSGDGVTYVYIL